MIDAEAQTEDAEALEDAQTAFERACKDFDDEELRNEMKMNKLDSSQIKHKNDCEKLKKLLT